MKVNIRATGVESILEEREDVNQILSPDNSSPVSFLFPNDCPLSIDSVPSLEGSMVCDTWRLDRLNRQDAATGTKQSL